MNTNEANEMRCIAAEIIVRLYEQKEWGQLKLLKKQIEASLPPKKGTP
jgi:hypothetical protein